jgi:sugar-specific transcriptional regulator TrmB
MGTESPETTDAADLAGEFLLGGVGVSRTEELIYRSLLRTGPASLAEVAQRTNLSAGTVRKSLPRLADLGLIARLTGRQLRLVASPPQLAVEALAARRYEEVTHARMAVDVLTSEASGQRRHSPAELLEVVIGREAVARTFAQINTSARRDVMALVQPPFATDLTQEPVTQNDALRRGIKARSIYDPRAFDNPRLLELAQALVARGEQARVGVVPIKLVVVDSEVAMIPLTSGYPGDIESAVVVHPSALLDALVSLFEILWRGAAPLGGRPPGGVGADGRDAETDASILSLLSVGLKDDTIARQLGMSLRSLQRRVRDIFDGLGAGTRFQAGYLAARRMPPDE